MGKLKIVLDTDSGVDDTAAALMLIKHPNVDLVAITCCQGNIDVLQATENAKRYVALSGRNIPIYAGSNSPIVPVVQLERWKGHADDGLGGFTETKEFQAFQNEYMKDLGKISIETEHAANALIQMANEHQGELIVIAIGPLSNIGLAIALDPNFLGKIKRLFVMGGAVHAKGNSSRTAEFNVHWDPEAAHIVFQSATKHAKEGMAPKVELITWECTLDHAQEWKFINSFANEKPLGFFLNQIVKKYQEYAHAYTPEPVVEAGLIVTEEQITFNDADDHAKKRRLCILPDIFAIIACVEPKSVLSFKDWDCQVELQGLYCRGTTHFQWAGVQAKKANCRTIFRMDRKIIESVMKQTFSNQ